MSENGWDKWSKHIIEELSRLSSGVTALDEDLTRHKIEILVSLEKIKSEIQLLKLRASIWGGISGGIATLVAALMSSDIFKR